jgi:simple sugar transport system permease protein
MLDFLTSLLTAGVVQGTPLILVALGEIVCERSGVLNLGLEGIMLMGAFSGFWAAQASGSLLVGCLAAIAGGAVLSLIHAVLTVSLRANQIVSGLALTIFGLGLSSFFGEKSGMAMAPAADSFRPLALPLLSRIPVLGTAFFAQDPLVYLSFFCLAAVWFLLRRTRAGLNIRSVGENPAAADVMGVDVTLTRYLCVLFGGGFAGLGGAYLSLALSPGWKEQMAAGRGWVAIALVIFGNWGAGRAALGALLFGSLYALDSTIQARGTVLPAQFLQMLPYLATIAFLVLARTRFYRKTLGAPEALGKPYVREAKE